MPFPSRDHDGVACFAALVSRLGGELHRSGDLRDVSYLCFVNVVPELFQVLHLCVDGGSLRVELYHHLFELGIDAGPEFTSGTFDWWVGCLCEVSPETRESWGDAIWMTNRVICLLFESD